MRSREGGSGDGSGRSVGGSKTGRRPRPGAEVAGPNGDSGAGPRHQGRGEDRRAGAKTARAAEDRRNDRLLDRATHARPDQRRSHRCHSSRPTRHLAVGDSPMPRCSDLAGPSDWSRPDRTIPEVRSGPPGPRIGDRPTSTLGGPPPRGSLRNRAPALDMDGRRRSGRRRIQSGPIIVRSWQSARRTTVRTRISCARSRRGPVRIGWPGTWRITRSR